MSTLIKRGKGEIFYDGCFKNHRDERVSVSVEELVPQDHFLRALMTDSTHIKANANKNKFVHKYKKEKAKFYIDELEAAVIEDREVHEKKN